MDAHQFLNTVLPDEGLYCLAIPFKLQGTQKTLYQHKVFDFKAEAAIATSKLSKHKDVFFCVHSLKDHRVWNSQKKNLKTNELGAYEIRVQTNMHSSKCFFMDLDIGNEEHKHSSQADAIQALRNFCNQYNLPKPMLVASGYGLHVYWLLDTALPSNKWKHNAKNLRALAQSFGLKFDPSRITDEASVLRVADTFNYKNASEPRSVHVLANGKPTNTTDFLSKISTTVASVSPLDNSTAHVYSLGYNLGVEYDGPIPSIKSLLNNCPAIAYLALNQELVSEPEWYAGINVARFVQEGRKAAHFISRKHPQYSYDETEAKLDQLDSKGIRPTSCEKIQEVCSIDHCNSCSFKGKVKSPIVAAVKNDIAEPIQLKGPTPIEVPTPRGFKRLAAGWIVKCGKNAEGEDTEVPIYEHELYPIRLLGTEAGAQQFSSMWFTNVPKSGPIQFGLNLYTIYDRKELLTTLANNGVMLHPGNIPDVQEYMIAYIKSLQATVVHDIQYNHFGWTKEKDSFILGNKLIKDGEYEDISVVDNAAKAVNMIAQHGTLKDQIACMKFYDKPKYIKHQFAILCSLASPIFYATGQHGAVVHLAGESGASKSTAIFAAAALWGKPSTYVLNGTRRGSTANSVTQRIHTLCHLPTIIDEVTHMSSQEAHDMAMGATQAVGRTRLTRDGKEKSEYSGDRSSLILTTANRSLHNLLAQENTAGTASSMRILEIECERLHVSSKVDADKFLEGIDNNYGHIGEAFIAYVVSHREAVEKRVQAVREALDKSMGIEASERFWSAVMAAALVAGAIARKQGFLDYDMTEMTAWCKTYIKLMRGQVTSEYTTPVIALTNFMEYNDGNMLVIDPPRATGNIHNVMKAPKGPLLVRYEFTDKKMWILKQAFKDFCNKIGMSVHIALAKLMEEGIVLEDAGKKVLGAGCSGYEKGQSRTILIDMKHPKINDVVEIEEVPRTNIHRIKR